MNLEVRLSRRILLTVLASSCLIPAAALALETTQPPQTQEKFPAAEMPELVRKEYTKEQQELQGKLARAQSLLADLESQKAQAFDKSKSLAQVDAAGVETLRKFDTLLTVRYVDGETKEFAPGLGLSNEDVENVNKLFENFLAMRPLKAPASAGKARHMVAWGVERLQDAAKTHDSPNEDNNSELEILARKIAEAAKNVEQVKVLALRLGVELSDGARTPAAEPGKK